MLWVLFEMGDIMNCIIANTMDMNEHGYYSHLIVEEYNQGTWRQSINRWFWKWEGGYDDADNVGGWVSCECPENCKNTYCFAMG